MRVFIFHIRHLLLGSILTTFLLGCQTPDSVRTASKQAQKESAQLDQYTHDLIDQLTQKTFDVEKNINADLDKIVQQSTSTRHNIYKLLIAYAEAKRDAIITSFEDRLITIETLEFDKALESNFNSPFNRALEAKITAFNQLHTESTNKPSDLQLIRRANDQERQILDMQYQAAEKEIELRKNFRAKAVQARSDLRAVAVQRFKTVEDHIKSLDQADSSDTNITRVDFAALRKSLKTDQETMRQGFEGHVQTLQALDDWINRPSEVKLFLLGALSQLRPNIDAGLQNFGKLLNLDQADISRIAKLVDSATESVASAADNKVAEVKTDLSENITKGLANLTAKTKTKG
jgi:hypothetical protein